MKLLAISLIIQACSILAVVWVNGLQSDAIVRHARQIDCLEQGRVWVFDEYCGDRATKQ